MKVIPTKHSSAQRRSCAIRLILALFAGLLFGIHPVAPAEPVKIEIHPVIEVAQAAEITWDKDSVIAFAKRETEAEHVNTDHFLKTIQCEVPKNADGSWDVAGQSRLPNKRDGGRENSWGTVQIHLPDHPEITKEQAQDPAFAIPWAVHQFATGHANMWSCWKSLYANV